MFVNELINLEIDVKLSINNNIKSKCSDQVCVAKPLTNMERSDLWCSMYSFCNGLPVFRPGLVEDIMVEHH